MNIESETTVTVILTAKEAIMLKAAVQNPDNELPEDIHVFMQDLFTALNKVQDYGLDSTKIKYDYPSKNK
jgi:hypothetical protein